jgi:uncharacterized protein (DUF427 family)
MYENHRRRVDIMSTTAPKASQTHDGLRIETGAKRIRAFLGGEAVADTIRPRLVWEKPYYPAYYFPAEDVRTDLVDAAAPGAITRFEDSPVEELRGLVRLDWDAMDAWFEEDEEVFVHPRSPYTRVDILPSSRHVRVEVDGVTIAESSAPKILFETGLPPRYYLPKSHVRMDLLEATDTVSHCPYKGQAEYWSVRGGERLHKDLAWSYRAPLPESQRIIGLVAFYNQRVDLYVDGVRQE